MGNVRLEIGNAIAEVILDRPSVNAIDRHLAAEIGATFGALASREDVNAVVLRAEGRGFCAGADLRAVPSPPSEGAQERMEILRRCLRAIESCPVPTIAALHGFALGAGYFMAACCDISLAEEDCEIGLPEIPRGMVGGYPFLRLNASPASARYLYLTGQYVSGREAKARGLVSDVCARGMARDSAIAVASRFAGLSRPFLIRAKALMERADRREAIRLYSEEHDELARLYADGLFTPPTHVARLAPGALSRPNETDEKG
jgi:enoyl-CoA hydratase/carnithine racemase